MAEKSYTHGFIRMNFGFTGLLNISNYFYTDFNYDVIIFQLRNRFFNPFIDMEE